MKQFLFILAATCVFIVNTRAQQEISTYFDDGGISGKNRLIKVGVDFLNGEYSVLYEQELFRNMSVEGALGLISISRQSNLYNYEPHYDLPQSGTGIFFAANIRFYL